MYPRDELFLRSLECYFGVHFPCCFATQEINTKTTLSWALKQFVTRAHTSFTMNCQRYNSDFECCEHIYQSLVQHYITYILSNNFVIAWQCQVGHTERRPSPGLHVWAMGCLLWVLVENDSVIVTLLNSLLSLTTEKYQSCAFPMLTNCQMDPQEQTSVEFETKYKNFHSWKRI